MLIFKLESQTTDEVSRIFNILQELIPYEEYWTWWSSIKWFITYILSFSIFLLIYSMFYLIKSAFSFENTLLLLNYTYLCTLDWLN